MNQIRKTLLLFTIVFLATALGSTIQIKEDVEIKQHQNNATLKMNDTFNFSKINVSNDHTDFVNNSERITVHRLLNQSENYTAEVTGFDYQKHVPEFKIIESSLFGVSILGINVIPLAFALISFTLAYLAVNTSDKYAELQIGNYIMSFIVMVFTGFLAYSYAANGESPAQVLSGWNNSFYFVAFMVVAVFLIHMLNNVLEATGKEVI